jgi:hypothetical protein
VAAAFVPGLLLHGSGHYVNGCTRSGTRLLWLEVTGLGLMIVALAPATVFGGNEYLVPFQAFLGMSGVALFAGSFLVDLYGVLVPASERGLPRNRQATSETFGGYQYVYDPLFDYRHFVVQGFELWQGAWRVRPRLDLSPSDGNVRYQLPVAWRGLGATATRPAKDGSFLEVVGALTEHQFPRDGFGLTTLEARVEGRLDLGTVEPDWFGTFAELGAGVGVNRYDYEAPGAGHDDNSLLLMGFAFGSYFGDPTRRGGEIKLGYDHRHDDYAAGLKLTGLGSGAAGHFLLRGRGYFDGHWGLGLDAEVGSAYVLGVSLLFRQGAQRED